jgi:hypothetical protein
VKQIPSLKKRFLYSDDYAKATISDIWQQKDLDGASRLICYDLETCWWENQGGKFIRRSLPSQVQISVNQGIAVTDVNADGNPDIIMAGNKYGFEVETNRSDAGNGSVLLGDGKGNFRWLDNTLSGFWASREVRDIALLKGAGNRQTVIVSNNNGQAQVFQTGN